MNKFIHELANQFNKEIVFEPDTIFDGDAESEEVFFENDDYKVTLSYNFKEEEDRVRISTIVPVIHKKEENEE